MGRLDELKLVRRLKAKDENAFQELLAHYRGFLKRILCHHGVPAFDQEAVLNEILHQVFGSIRSLRRPWDLKKWLRTVSKRACCRYNDTRAPGGGTVARPLQGTEEDKRSATEPKLDGLDRQHVRNVWNQLPDSLRIVVDLVIREELSFVQVGKRLNVTRQTARSRFDRALLVMRARLGGDWRR